MNQKKNIYCLTPIYNDWESFAVLVQEISLLKQNFSAYDFFIVAVNDGSTEDISEDFDYKNIPATVLNLKINKESYEDLKFVKKQIVKYEKRVSIYMNDQYLFIRFSEDYKKGNAKDNVSIFKIDNL